MQILAYCFRCGTSTQIGGGFLAVRNEINLLYYKIKKNTAEVLISCHFTWLISVIIFTAKYITQLFAKLEFNLNSNKFKLNKFK